MILRQEMVGLGGGMVGLVGSLDGCVYEALHVGDG